MYTNDQLTDFVNEWLSNNPERLNQFYDDNAGFQAWKREAAERIQNRDVNTQSGADVLEAFATEVEAPYEAIVFSSNEDGDYMLIDLGQDEMFNWNAEWAVQMASRALNYYQMDGDSMLDTEKSYQVDANDAFVADHGKWRIFYAPRVRRYDVYSRLDWHKDEPENWTLLGQSLTAEEAYQVATSDDIDRDAREEAVVCYAGTKNKADNDEIY